MILLENGWFSDILPPTKAKIKGPILFTTDRLTVRMLVPADAEAYHQIFGDPEICRFDDFVPCSPEQALKDVLEIISLYGTSSDKHEYAVEIQETGQVCGVLCFHLEERIPYIGYHFARTGQGKGYASESVSGLLDWLRHQQGFKEVRAAVSAENTRSVQLLVRCGMRHDHTRPVPTAGEPVFEDVYHTP